MTFRRCASAVALRIGDQRRHDDKNKGAQQEKLFLNLNLPQCLPPCQTDFPPWRQTSQLLPTFIKPVIRSGSFISVIVERQQRIGILVIVFHRFSPVPEHVRAGEILECDGSTSRVHWG